jgi:hypothetical protein
MTKSLSSNLTRRSGQPNPCRATMRGIAGDQVPTEQPCEEGQATKSLSSNLARRSKRPSPYRETLRGGADDQVPAEKPYQRLA